MSGLDLSSLDSARKGGTQGPALSPIPSADSLLLDRVLKGQMPPTGALPPGERQILARWVKAGAPWTDPIRERRAGLDWWSLQPLRIRPGPSPEGLPADWSRSAIDRWIFAKLRQNGLRPSPPADRPTLIRRVTYDLLGLPPKPEDIEAFLKDSAPDAYEKLIERLLDSPHYGERWARHWLDVVRFAESEGFERDLLRDHAWHYRDYVIRSFNSDMPYTTFAREQIAGDVLEPVTQDGIIATGLLVLGPTDAIGLTSAVPRERAQVREDQLEELLGAVGQTFLGLTVNCARCHDHKFDPIPQKDYSRMKAALDAVWQPTRGDAAGDLDEMMPDGRILLTPAELAERERLVLPIRRRIEELEAELGALYRAASPTLPPPDVPQPFARWRFDTDTRDDIGVIPANIPTKAELAGGRLRPSAGQETATLATVPLPVDVREKTLEAWVLVRKLPEKPITVFEIRNRSGFRGASVDGLQYAGGKKTWENFSIGRFRSEDVDGSPEDTNDDGRLHLAIAYDTDGTIRIYRNGQPYGKPYKPETEASAGRLQTYGKGDAIVRFTVSKNFEIEEARLYNTALSSEQIAASFAVAVRNDTRAALKTSLDEQSLGRLTALEQELADKKRELSSIPEPAKVFAATTLDLEADQVLVRREKGEQVPSGAVSCIKGLPADFGLEPDTPDASRRRKLAEWISSPENPLFSRVMVNRVWHYHFGAGLVENPNDFGFNGGEPSHPELLDWLATEFIRNGWSVKKLHKAILLSQAYRQSSRFSPEAAAKDSDNRLLWRFSPRRLQSEAVRDAILAASGKLNTKMFGPSFRPFKLINVGAYQGYDLVESSDPEHQRRTIYRMNVNTGGQPMLDALDCPVPSVKTPKRSVTTTPLQALSLMNSGFVQRQAKAFAERLRADAGDVGDQIGRAFQLAFGRAPDGDDLSRSRSLIERHGLETFCWGLFNASEFIYVE